MGLWIIRSLLVSRATRRHKMRQCPVLSRQPTCLMMRKCVGFGTFKQETPSTLASDR